LATPTILARIINLPTLPAGGLWHIQRDRFDNLLIGGNGVNFIKKIDNQNLYSSASINPIDIILNNNIPINVAFQSSYTLPQLIPELTPQCINDVVVTTNVPAGSDKKQASSTIKASNIISSGANAIYHAGGSVILINGFNAKAGSKFHAYIADCNNTFTQKINTEKTAVLSENVKINLVKLYPNPNTGIFRIDLGFDNKNEIAIRIYDAQGKVVYNSNTKGATSDVSLPNLTDGLYIVKLQGNNYNDTLKFIKE
jgi:hypothetical protein